MCPQALEESEKLLLTAIRRNPNIAALKVIHYYALKQGFERIVIKHCKYVYQDIVQDCFCVVLTRLKGPSKNEFRLTISTTDLVMHRALIILLFLGGKIRFRSKILFNFSRF